MNKEELEKLKQTIAYFGHWYDVIGEERVAILEKSIGYIEELEKENAELKTKVTALENANRAMVKELDDTTSGGLNILQNVVKNKEQLTNAKEIIKKFLLWENDWHNKTESKYELLKQAEQFLKDCEVEK